MSQNDLVLSHSGREEGRNEERKEMKPNDLPLFFYRSNGNWPRTAQRLLREAREKKEEEGKEKMRGN